MVIVCGVAGPGNEVCVKRTTGVGEEVDECGYKSYGGRELLCGSVLGCA